MGWGNVIEFEGSPYLGEHFVGTLEPHPSWASNRIQPWFEVRTELVAALADARQVEFTVDPAEPPDRAAARLQNLVNTMLINEPTLRKAPVNWSVTAQGRPLGVTQNPRSLVSVSGSTTD